MATTTGKAVWAGRIISGLVSALFVFSGIMKVMGGPDLEKGFAHLGLPMSMRLPLAVLELACIAVYIVPQTAVTGAILMTGYIGGAMLTHWRIGEPPVTHIVIGLLLWLGLYLREGRLKALLPLRK